MKLPKWTSIFFTSVLLSACGGSDNTPETDIQLNPTPTLTVKAEVENQCGEISPYSNATLVFHNENGDAIKEISGVENGKFSVPIPQDAKHASLIGKTRYKLQEIKEEDKITTFLDIQSGDLGIVRFTDTSIENNCGCRELVVNIEGLYQFYPNHLIGASSLSTLNSHTTSIEAEVCSSDNNMLAIQLVSNDYKTANVALIDMTGRSEYQLKVTDFNHLGNKLTVTTDLQPPSSQLSAYQLKSNPSVGTAPITRLHSRFIFPSLGEYTEFQATGIVYGGSRYFIKGRLPDNGNISTLSPISFNAENRHLQVEIGQALTGKAYPISYDFSSMDSLLSEYRFTVHYYKDNRESSVWNILGGISGSIPDFQLKISGDRFSQIELVSPVMGVIAYAQAYDLQTLRDAIAQRQQSANWKVSSPLETSRALLFTIQN